MGRALPALVDLVAERLLDLRLVSGTQWLLRGIAAAAMTAALVLTLPDGVFAHVGAGALTIVVGGGVLIQSLRPDLDIGTLPPVAVILALAGQPDLSVLRALAVGLVLLTAHIAWALAATIPAHGSFSAPALALTGRAALLVLVASLIGSTVVVALSPISLGPWMIVAGSLGVIVLCALILPRER
ncbi:MAG TPA: hypothetical protein VK122_05240 [Brachybacterium sp.]|nr:hypothetical protein [Brachybacterium sp.]